MRAARPRLHCSSIQRCAWIWDVRHHLLFGTARSVLQSSALQQPDADLATLLCCWPAAERCSRSQLPTSRDVGWSHCVQVGSDHVSLQELQHSPTVGHVLNACFEAAVETTLQQPTYVTDYPVEISPLAKKHRTQPGLVERFELFVAGGRSGRA